MSDLQPPNFFGQPAHGVRGAWAWELSGTEGQESPEFLTRLDAQAWLGENIPKLRTASITRAQLTRQGEPVGQAVEI